MGENITVNRAIWRARIRLNILPVVICLAMIGLSVYLVEGRGYENWLIGVTCLVCIPCVPLYRSTMSVRWYIWALNNVRNVHELRQRAIFERILSRTNEHSALTSGKEQEQIRALEQKFDVPDEYVDDQNIPMETKIYLGKTKRVLMLIVMSICFLAGVVLLVVSHLYIAGGIVCAVSGYLIYDSYTSLSDSSPQITISNEGITTNISGFHSWKTIKNEFVGIVGETDNVPLMERRSTRGDTTYYLSYDYDDQHEEYPLYELRINHWKMAKLLRVYRGRSI